MSDFTHVKPGDKRIKARSFNTLLDFGRMFQTQLRNRGVMPGVDAFQSAVIIPVANISESAIDRFSPMALKEPLILPADNEIEFQNKWVMKVDIPTTADMGKFCVLLDDLPAKYENASSEEVFPIGRAIISGATPVRINIVNEFHKWADVDDDSSSADPLLQSNWVGAARIIWKEAGSGSVWAVVTLGHRRPEPIFVGLETDGGIDGTLSAAPTYTYAASDEDGNEIEVGLEPSHDRPLGNTLPANFGWLLINPPNDPDLLVTDERPNFAECSEES